MGESRGKSSGLVPGALTDVRCRATPSGSRPRVSGTGARGVTPGWTARVDPVAAAVPPGQGLRAARVKHADAASVKAVDAAHMASDLRKRHETGSGRP